MILTCPACQTQYIVPEGALGAKSRTVKCASCGYSWKQSPIAVTEIAFDLPTDMPLATSPSTPPTDPMNADPATTPTAADMAQALRWQQALQADITAVVAPRLSNRQFLKQIALWLGVLLVATAIALIYLRDDLARLWPPSNLFFEAIGFPEQAAGAGLLFENDVTAVMETNSIPLRLHVSGRFRNTRPHAVALPVLQARLFDNRGEWLKDWSIPLDTVNYIGGGKTMGFDYTLPQVPQDAYRLTFRFTDA